MKKALTYFVFFLLAYFLLVSFTRLWYLPVTYAKIQVTELLFIPLACIALWHYNWRLLPTAAVGIPLALYVAANVASALFSGQRDALLEGLGRIYLAFLCLIVATYLRESGLKETFRLLNWWVKGAIALASISVLGYVVAASGYLNETVRVYENYPYFGTVLRAAGLNGGSGMLAVVLFLPSLWVWYQWRYSGKNLLPLLLFCLTLLLTLSKEVLLVALGFFLLDPRATQMRPWIKTLLVGCTALFFILATHWVIVPNQPIEDTYLGGMRYTSEKVWFKWGPVQVVETTYWALKRANWVIGWRNPFLGVGPGEFYHVVGSLKSEGLYAAHLPDYDPHSTWLGAWSETGLIGFLTLLGLCLSWGRLLVKNNSDYSRVFNVFLLIMLINSASMDCMNLRQLWLVWGLGLAMVSPKSL